MLIVGITHFLCLGISWLLHSFKGLICFIYLHVLLIWNYKSFWTFSPSVRWLSRLNMAAVGYAERERIRQEQGEGSLCVLLESLNRWLLQDGVFNYWLVGPQCGHTMYPSLQMEYFVFLTVCVWVSCRLLEWEWSWGWHHLQSKTGQPPTSIWYLPTASLGESHLTHNVHIVLEHTWTQTALSAAPQSIWQINKLPLFLQGMAELHLF